MKVEMKKRATKRTKKIENEMATIEMEKKDKNIPCVWPNYWG